jgi:hypothetical protein
MSFIDRVPPKRPPYRNLEVFESDVAQSLRLNPAGLSKQLCHGRFAQERP